MAEIDSRFDEEEEEEIEEEEPRSSIPWLRYALIAVAVVVGLGVVFLTSYLVSDFILDERFASGDYVAYEEKEVYEYISLPRLQVNLNQPSVSAQAELILAYPQENITTADVVQEKMPQIIDQIQFVISEKTFHQLQDPDYKENELRNELKDVINQILGSNEDTQIEEVFIVSFMVARSTV